MPSPLLVTARLVSPLAGDPPQLDALCEYLRSLHHRKGEPGYKIDRQFPAPEPGVIPIPLARRWVVVPRDAGPSRVERHRSGCPPPASDPAAQHLHLVGACSDPIVGAGHSERVEHVNKRIGVERAAMLAPERRTVVATTNSWTKSYRLPLRLRSVPLVRWFALGDRGALLDLLRRCPAIGKKISVGYGRVEEWAVDPAAADGPLWPWWIATEHGPLLMRTLPAGDYLPAGLVGARQDFGAPSPPYWHPERYCPILKPC